MGIVVTGSVAFDNIMDFPGHFKDHILPEKVHVLSVSFLVDTLKRQRGGAGANVAYNLALLGERPRLLATVGEDFGEYREQLESSGVDTSAVRVVPGELTASAFITTDLDDNQIAGFYPGAMRRAGELSLEDTGNEVGLVVVMPDDPAAMSRFPDECRSLGIPFVFAPGQQIVSLSPESLARGMNGAKCLVGNDYEMEMIASKTNHSPADLLNLAGMVVTTYGDRGSRISTAGGVVEIGAVSPARVVDPTGAGDAYLSGIARGLARGDRPEDFGRIAALAASYAVAQHGTQAHSYSRAEFVQACVEHFGKDLLSEV